MGLAKTQNMLQLTCLSRNKNVLQLTCLSRTQSVLQLTGLAKTQNMLQLTNVGCLVRVKSPLCPRGNDTPPGAVAADSLTGAKTLTRKTLQGAYLVKINRYCFTRTSLLSSYAYFLFIIYTYFSESIVHLASAALFTNSAIFTHLFISVSGGTVRDCRKFPTLNI